MSNESKLILEIERIEAEQEKIALRGEDRMTVEKWEKFCKENPPEKAAEKLRGWVDDGQPNGFLDGFFWREMCKLTVKFYEDRSNLNYMNYYGYMSGWPLVELDSPNPPASPRKRDKTS